MVFPSGRGERPLGLAAAAGGGCEGVRGGGAGGPEAPLSAPLPPRPAQPGEPGAAPSARGAARQDHVGHGRAGQGDPPGLQAVSARRGPEGEAGGRTGRGRGRGRGGRGLGAAVSLCEGGCHGNASPPTPTRGCSYRVLPPTAGCGVCPYGRGVLGPALGRGGPGRGERGTSARELRRGSVRALPPAWCGVLQRQRCRTPAVNASLCGSR